MKIMPFAGTLVTFARSINDDTGKVVIHPGKLVGYVTSRNRAMNTMRVCVGTGNYRTVALADATAV